MSTVGLLMRHPTTGLPTHTEAVWKFVPRPTGDPSLSRVSSAIAFGGEPSVPPGGVSGIGVGGSLAKSTRRSFWGTPWNNAR